MLIMARLEGSFAIARGAGRRLRSSGMPMLEAVEPTLEAERFRLWPLLWPPWLLIVLERGRLLPWGRTRSVLICLWNLVLVAASESPGISSLTWTV